MCSYEVSSRQDVRAARNATTELTCTTHMDYKMPTQVKSNIWSRLYLTRIKSTPLFNHLCIDCYISFTHHLSKLQLTTESTPNL